MGSQPLPFRLAILEADTPLQQTRSEYGSYGGVFRSMFERAVAPVPISSILSLSFHDIVGTKTTSSAITTPTPTTTPPRDAYPALDSIDGILISGSRYDAFESEPWIVELVEYVRKALASDGRVRVIGVCFGHQIIGRALGVPVGRNIGGWEVSVTKVRLKEKGRELLGGKEVMKIQQMHRDSVSSIPAGAEPLAESDVCAVQGLVVPGKAMTVQGHPEFTEAIVRELLEARRTTGVISDELYRSGMARVGDEHDGLSIARAFLAFLGAYKPCVSSF